MSANSSGMIKVGSRTSPVVVPNTQTATVTHNSNKRADYILVTDDNGGPVDGVTVTVNGTDSFNVQNSSGGALSLIFFAYMSISSIQVSGEIPSSAVVVA